MRLDLICLLWLSFCLRGRAAIAPDGQVLKKASLPNAYPELFRVLVKASLITRTLVLIVISDKSKRIPSLPVKVSSHFVSVSVSTPITGALGR
jgi:hypothetical protein